MTPRTRIAALQVAVFVGGGLLAPVIHLATHRADHTHGAGGQTITFDIAPAQGGGAGARRGEHHRQESQGEGRARHQHRAEAGGHAHADSHAHAHPHAGSGHGHAHPSPHRASDVATSPPTEEGSPAPRAEAQPLESIHGHGSIAHFGLALLSAAPPLALPAPEATGELPGAPHPRAAALFQPGFPLPRPPPAAALS
jgi:hypothetical protein